MTTEGVSVKVCLFVFAFLSFADERLNSKSLSDLHKRLHDGFLTREVQFMFMEDHDPRDLEHIMALSTALVKAGSQGPMVTAPDEVTKTSRTYGLTL